jgi:predicted dehydrogenase
MHQGSGGNGGGAGKVRPVKLAFVGCGAITRASNLPAGLRSPWIDVSALVDVALDNARALQRHFGLSCEVAGDLREVIDRVDGVFIATPNHTHRAVAEIALGRGKPALIEKPLTTTYADARRLCELADRNGTFLSVGYRSRHWGGVRTLKHLLDANFLGGVRRFHYECGNTGSWEAVSGYSVNRAQAGGGILLDAHAIDKILYWFGEPSGFSYADDSHGGVEANCKAELTFDRGGRHFSGTLFLSKAIELQNKIVLETESYRCELEEKENAEVALFPRDHSGLRLSAATAAVAPEEPGKNDFQRQLEEFARNIRQRGALTVDGWFAARSVRLIEEMYRNRRALAEPWAFAAPGSNGTVAPRGAAEELLVRS